LANEYDLLQRRCNELETELFTVQAMTHHLLHFAGWQTSVHHGHHRMVPQSPLISP
jgi:hypothetical protein